jgi:hypothetical protein
VQNEASRPPIGEPAVPSRITVQPLESELRIGNSLEAEQRRLTRRFTRR